MFINAQGDIMQIIQHGIALLDARLDYMPKIPIKHALSIAPQAFTLIIKHAFAKVYAILNFISIEIIQLGNVCLHAQFNQIFMPILIQNCALKVVPVLYSLITGLALVFLLLIAPILQ